MAYGIRDVAEQAGVSKSTVSRVLNQSKLVDPDTRRRVLEATRRLKYYRNASAQRLALGGKSNFFGLLISDIENPVFPEMIKGFETAAAAKGYDLFLCATNYDTHRTRSAVRKMIENGVRGAAIMTSSATADIAEELAASQIAVLVVDLEINRRHISSIMIDYSQGIDEAVEHLAQFGHQHVIFVAGPDERRSAKRYKDSVMNALQGRSLKLQQIIECDQTLAGGREVVWRLTTSAKQPTALLCINDQTAIGAMNALRELGLRVPEDVSVIGCEDISMARFVNPPLTTVKLDRQCLGQMAFEVLERMSSSKQRKGTQLLLDTHLVVRSSTAQCNAQPRAWKR